MSEQYVPTVQQSQELFVHAGPVLTESFRCLVPERRHDAGMEPRRLTNKQFNAHVIDRIEGLAADMGMDKNQLAGAIHEEIGITKRGALQYFNKDRRSIPPYSLAIIADWIGVDIAYIMLGTDDLSSCVKKHGRYAFATSAKETAAQ